MASVKEMTTKDGKRFYKISVSRGHGISPYVTRWYFPDGFDKLSAKTQKRERDKVVAEFERACAAGEILTRKDKAKIKEDERLAEEKMPTFRDYAESTYLPFKRTYCKETYIEWCEDMLLHINEEFGDYKVRDITSTMCQKYFLKLASENFAYSTKRGIYITLHGVLQMATDNDLIVKNPCLARYKPQQDKSSVKDKEIQYCDTDAVLRMRECAKNEPLLWQVALNVLLDTGIRRGELAGITWNAIDFSTGAINIKVNIIKTKGGVKVSTPKGGKRRTVYVSQETLTMLRQLRSYQRNTKIIDIRHGKNDLHFVFSQKGDPFSPIYPDTITTHCKEFGERYGFEGFHTHMTRHSWASNAILNGADVVTVSKNLGHSDPSITLEIYSHASDQAIKETAEMLHRITHMKEA